jgi:hypothetical protein
VAVLFSSDAARYSAFTADLEALQLPEGSVKDFEFGSDYAASRNALVQRAIDRGSYWIWFISEDHSFAPDIVATLLSRDKQIVAPVVLSTMKPVHALAYKGVSRASRRLAVQLDDVVGPGTLIEIESASTAGMLVRRAVFEALPKPWFPNDVDDELLFCDSAYQANFEPFLDTSARLGNRCTASMYPSHRAGKWELSVAVGSDIELSVPIQLA